MNHGSLFSGIGGFDYAAKAMGWNNVFHCEINPFCQHVLKYYYPTSISYEDIKRTDFTIHRDTIDVLSGVFPCQPYSAAGKRLGKEDDRHLWPEMLRAIREIQPRWVVGENVRGFTNWNEGLVFDEVQSDLEAQGYEVLPFLLPAVAVDAPHRRDRIWIIAYSTGKRREEWQQYNGWEDSEENKTRMDNRITPDSGLLGSEKCEKQTARIKQCDKGITTYTDINQRCERRLYEERPIKTERHVSSCDALSHEWRAWEVLR